MTQVKYPEMRSELVGHLRDLADCSKIRNGRDSGSLLDYAVHFLFDDTEAAEDPHSLIGWLLEDPDEADAIKLVCDAISSMFEAHGTEMSDSFYLQCGEWKAVKSAAQNTLTFLERPRI